MAGATFSGSGTKILSRSLINTGTINWTGGQIYLGGIDNVAGATFSDQDGPRLDPVNNSVFNNEGIFQKTGSSSTTVTCGFNNQGIVEVAAGTLDMECSVSQLVQQPGTLIFTLNGGTWRVLNGTKIYRAFSDVQITALQQAATVRLSGPGATFYGIDGLLINNGSFQIDSGKDFTTVGDFSNNGTLIVGSNSNFIVPAGNVLTNTGSIQGAGIIAANVQSSGTISPGTSPGTLTFNGNLSLQNGAMGSFALAGTQPGAGYDHVAVTGNLALAGSLHVSFAGGFQSQIQRSGVFDLFTTTGAISGAFDIPSGSRLFTTDGIGSFLLTYPGEDSKSVVLSDYLARGDFDQNGLATTADISAMLQALSDLSQYQSMKSLNGDELNAVGDLNGSGIVDNLDVQNLINLIANSTASNQAGSSAQPVPEPPAFTLAAALFSALALASRRIAHCRSA